MLWRRGVEPQAKELGRAKCQQVRGLALPVAELDLERLAVVENLNHRAHVTARAPFRRNILGQGNNIKQSDLARHAGSPFG